MVLERFRFGAKRRKTSVPTLPHLDRITRSLTDELRELRPDCPPVHVTLDESLPAFDATLRHEGSRLHIITGARSDVHICMRFLEARAATPAWWLLNADNAVEEVSISLSDGDQPTLAPFSFSSFTPDQTLVPDPYFLRRRAFTKIQRHADRFSVAWDERSSDVIWRGHFSGQGMFSLHRDLADHPGVKQRLRLALKAQELQGIDVRFVPGAKSDAAALLAAGLLGDRVQMTSWKSCKFAIDIDGFSNAWSNLLERFHLGCCVLKVDSPFGFRQWYYDRLIPFETHVPVRADLSDLAEKLDWIRANDTECQAIAANGQALARSLDFDSVTRWAGDAVTARTLGQPHPNAQ